MHNNFTFVFITQAVICFTQLCFSVHSFTGSAWHVPIEAGAVEAVPEGGDYQVDINLATVGMVKVISDENQHVDPQSKHEAAIGRMTPSQTEEFVEPGEIMLALEQFKLEQSKNT